MCGGILRCNDDGEDNKGEKGESLSTGQVRILSQRKKIEERSRSSDKQTQADCVSYFLSRELNAFPR